jgi:voltage-gated potassium channel Kch
MGLWGLEQKDSRSNCVVENEYYSIGCWDLSRGDGKLSFAWFLIGSLLTFLYSMYTKWREHRPMLPFISAGKAAAFQTIASEVFWSAIVGCLIGDVLGEIMTDITQGQFSENTGEVYVSKEISLIPIMCYLGFFLFVEFISKGSSGVKVSQIQQDFFHDFGFEVLSFVFNVLSLLAYLQCCYYYAGFRFRSEDLGYVPGLNSDGNPDFNENGAYGEIMELLEQRCPPRGTLGDTATKGYGVWPKNILDITNIALRLDFLIRFIQSKNKLTHMSASGDGIQNLVDFLSVSDFPAWLVCLYNSPGQLKANGGISVSNSFGFLKFLRILRFANDQYVKGYLGGEGSKHHKLLVAALELIACLFLFAGFAFTIEFPDEKSKYAEGAYWGIVCFDQAWYFAIVTLTTVGYGDFSPVTLRGRLLIGMGMLTVLGLAASLIGDVVKILMMFNEHEGGYAVSKQTKHIIICGNLVQEDVQSFMTEFFHENHGTGSAKGSAKKRHIVLLSTSLPDDVWNAMLDQFHGKVTWLRYQRNRSKHMRMALERAGLSACDGIFVLGDQSSTKPEKEDALAIMWTVILRKSLLEVHVQKLKVARAAWEAAGVMHFSSRPRSESNLPRTDSWRWRSHAAAIQNGEVVDGAEIRKINITVQVALEENVKHARMAGASQVVCTRAFKHKLMAKSFNCMGLTTLVGNLIKSTDGGGSFYKDTSSLEVYQVEVLETHAGKTLCEVSHHMWNLTAKRAAQLRAETNAENLTGGILLFGLREHSTEQGSDDYDIKLSPSTVLKKGDIGLVLADSEDDARKLWTTKENFIDSISRKRTLTFSRQNSISKRALQVEEGVDMVAMKQFEEGGGVGVEEVDELDDVATDLRPSLDSAEILVRNSRAKRRTSLTKTTIARNHHRQKTVVVRNCADSRTRKRQLKRPHSAENGTSFATMGPHEPFIVILVPTGCSMDGVEEIIVQTKQSNSELGLSAPPICVVKSNPPVETVSYSNKLSFIDGNPINEVHLHAADVGRAALVIIMSSEQYDNSEIAEALAYMVDDTKVDDDIIGDSETVKIMLSVRAIQAIERSAEAYEDQEAEEGDESAVESVEKKRTNTATAAVAARCMRRSMIFELRSSDNIVFADPTPWNQSGEEYITAPIYAAGYVYTAGMLSTLLCQSYFNPYIIKVLERLVGGSQSLVHMLAPAHLIDEPYSRVFEELSREGKVPMAVFANDASEAAEQMLPDISLARRRANSASRGTNQRKSSQKYTGDGTPLLPVPTLPVLLTNPGPDYPISAGDYILYIPAAPQENTQEDSTAAQNRSTHLDWKGGTAGGAEGRQPQPQRQWQQNPLPLGGATRGATKMYRVQHGVAAETQPSVGSGGEKAAI